MVRKTTFYNYEHKNEVKIRYILSFLLPPVKIKEPANPARLVTVSRLALHYVNTEGVAEDRSLLRAGSQEGDFPRFIS